MQGGYDGEAFRFLEKGLQQRVQHGLFLQQVVAVEGEQQVIAFAQPQAVEPYRLNQAVPVVADGVNEDVSHIMDIVGYHALLVEVAVGHHACGEEVIRDGIYDGTVHLARHVHVERSGAGNDVCHLQSPFLGYDGAAHGGSHVVHHQHHIGRAGIQFFLESQHDVCRYLRMVMSADAQVGIRLWHGQVGKEGRLKGRVVVRAGVDNAVGNILACFACGVHGTAQRGYLHEVGACARDDSYFHRIDV